MVRITDLSEVLNKFQANFVTKNLSHMYIAILGHIYSSDKRHFVEMCGLGLNYKWVNKVLLMLNWACYQLM